MNAVTARRSGQRSTPTSSPTRRGAAAERTWLPDCLDRDVRHRHGLPWYAAQIPRRWHSCRPQTIELHRTNGSLIGICHCACGALTDRTGRWTGRNSRRRIPDPAGLRRDPETPQPVRAWVTAGPPHPGARRHPRSYQTDDLGQQRRARL
ncbi:MAG: hypothetical protein ACRDRX_16025 [Pseudonocardiaceae bacterium]